MSYTPVELRHVRVGRSLLGYNRAMVEQMIEEVAESFEATWRERSELSDRVEELEKQIVELRRREELLTHTLVAAEQAASNVREQARRTAEMILSEAQQEARALLRSAQTRRETLGLESRRIEGLLRAALVMIEEHAEPAALAYASADLLGSELDPAVAAPPPELSVERQPVGVEREARSGSPWPAAGGWQAQPAAPDPEPERADVAATSVGDTPTPRAPEEELVDAQPESWPLEQTGEFKPVGLPPVAGDPEAAEESVEATPFLRRLAGGKTRDFDWGD
jgi:cell division initiation protein